MGIIKKSTDDFLAVFASFKTTATPTRAQQRAYVAGVNRISQEWLNKHDAQQASAPADFATSRAAQFVTFTAALPEPVLDPVDPAT